MLRRPHAHFMPELKPYYNVTYTIATHPASLEAMVSTDTSAAKSAARNYYANATRSWSRTPFQSFHCDWRRSRSVGYHALNSPASPQRQSGTR